MVKVVYIGNGEDRVILDVEDEGYALEYASRYILNYFKEEYEGISFSREVCLYKKGYIEKLLFENMLLHISGNIDSWRCVIDELNDIYHRDHGYYYIKLTSE